MLFLIAILGGLLIMMGQHSRSEALFYYFRLEDQVPETQAISLKCPAQGDDECNRDVTPTVVPSNQSSRIKESQDSDNGDEQPR